MTAPPAALDRAVTRGPPSGEHRVLFGRYRLESLLGRGGTAEAWRAVDLRRGAVVTLKLLHPELWQSRRALARFESEASVAHGLAPSGTVRVLGRERGRDGVAIVFEHVPGETLAARLERGPLEARDGARIAAVVAATLARAHAAGLVHRDVKPGNILLATDGSVRLLDFGIATTMEPHDAVTSAGLVVGTLGYLSPERLRGDPATRASDVYALGVVLGEMLRGRSGPRPGGAQLQEGGAAGVDVPAGLAAIAAAAVVQDPSARLADATQLERLLRAWLHGADVSQGLAASVPPRAGSGDTTVMAIPVAAPRALMLPGWTRRATAAAIVGLGAVFAVTAVASAPGGTAPSDPPTTPNAVVDSTASPSPTERPAPGPAGGQGGQGASDKDKDKVKVKSEQGEDGGGGDGDDGDDGGKDD